MMIHSTVKIPAYRHLAVVILIALSSVTSGCNGGLGLATVEGVVTLNGEPLPDARVIFYPQAGGRPSNAITDLDGSYSLVYVDDVKGALPGSHNVWISTFVEADPDSTDILVKTGQKETLPAKYNSQTTLKAELQRGARTTLDFDLTTS